MAGERQPSSELTSTDNVVQKCLGGMTLDTVQDELWWQAYGSCPQTDPDAFYPENGAANPEAQRVCQNCIVREECLDYALSHDEEYGIWGGLSERQRRKLKRQIA